jgi:hypothetical protein
MNHDRPAQTLSLLMLDTSPERLLQISVYLCGNGSIRICSTPLVMHSKAQVNWFCGEKVTKGWRKKQKTRVEGKKIKKRQKGQTYYTRIYKE